MGWILSRYALTGSPGAARDMEGDAYYHFYCAEKFLSQADPVWKYILQERTWDEFPQLLESPDCCSESGLTKKIAYVLSTIDGEYRDGCLDDPHKMLDVLQAEYAKKNSSTNVEAESEFSRWYYPHLRLYNYSSVDVSILHIPGRNWYNSGRAICTICAREMLRIRLVR